MELIQSYLKEHSNIPYVIDPVMLAKSGDSLMDENTKNHLQSTLLPLADVVTPNIPEAEEITGIKINDEESIRKAGQIFINEIGSKGVVIKGGHSADLNNAKDFLLLRMKRIPLRTNALILNILMELVVLFQQLLQN